MLEVRILDVLQEGSLVDGSNILRQILSKGDTKEMFRCEEWGRDIFTGEEGNPGVRRSRYQDNIRDIA